MKAKITIKMLTIEGDVDALPLVSAFIAGMLGAPDSVDQSGVSSRPHKKVEAVKQVPTKPVWVKP